jgi:hypothetical protein
MAGRVNGATMIRNKIFYWFFLLLTLCTPSAMADSTTYKDVSMVSLLANPQMYAGKNVRVEGFLKYQFEDTALYFGQDQADGLMLKSSLGISIPANAKPPANISGEMASAFNGRYVFVEGKFKASDQKYIESYAGSISNIVRIEPLK